VITQLIQVINVAQENSPGSVRRNGCAIQTGFLSLSVVGAQTNYISLISGYKNKFVLAKKAEDCRIRLPCFVTGFYRKRDVVIITELKTYYRVPNPAGSPIGKKEISSPQLGEIDSFVSPAVCELVSV
jgi:hypothetical protein